MSKQQFQQQFSIKSMEVPLWKKIERNENCRNLISRYIRTVKTSRNPGWRALSAGWKSHARRVRYYESMLDTTCLEKGTSYEKLPELYVIYLSEKDLWRGGKTLYTVEKKLSGTDIPYDDGVHITYANAEVKDGTEIARTMQYFKESDPMDQSHGALSKRVHYLKCEEGGYQEMCEVAEKIYKEGVTVGHTEGLAEGEMKKAKETAFMLADRGMSTSDIAEIIKVSSKVVEEWLSEKF